MNNTVIYYFSATGNSFIVAQDIARHMDARLIPVASARNQKSINTNADTIGFVFPIYDFKPPPIVEDLVCKIKDISSKYIFAVCTYGFMPSGALKHFDDALKNCGGHLSSGFSVAMPHNGIGSGIATKAEHEKMYKNWETSCAQICLKLSNHVQFIDSKKKMNLKFFSMLPTLLRFAFRVMAKGIDSLSFCANETCDGCGICQKVCPIENIKLIDRRPVWSADECAGCFGCLHWCPKQAISLGGFDANMRIYHHPEVTLADIAAANNLNN